METKRDTTKLRTKKGVWYFEQLALLVMAIIYPAIHHTLSYSGWVNGFEYQLPAFPPEIISLTFLALIGVSFLVRENRFRVSMLGYLGMEVFLALIIYLNFLNNFDLIFQIFFWVSLIFLSFQCDSRLKLITFFVLNFILSGIAVILAGQIPYPKFLFFIWYPILALVAYWILAKAINYKEKLIEANKQLFQNEEMFKLIFEEAPYGIVVTSLNKDILRVNKALTQMLGFERDELIGMNSREISHPEHSGLLKNLFNEAMNKGKDSYSSEKRYLKKNGEEMLGKVSVRIIRDKFGHHLFNIGIIEDIGLQKIAEEKIKNYAFRLKQSNKDLEEFAYAVSHDLREPLRMVSSYLQLLQKRFSDDIDTNATEYIHFATDGAKRMDALIQDLLSYSRVGREKNMEEVNLNDVMDIVKHNLKLSIEESNTNIIYQSLPKIQANKTQMIVLFQNLLQNAIKYRKDGIDPVINIKCRKDESEWEFAVQDNGRGIENRFLTSIFTIFNRASSDVSTRGSGIGLAICKKIVQAHEGRIWVESAVNLGSTFWFTVAIDSNSVNFSESVKDQSIIESAEPGTGYEDRSLLN